MFKKLLVLGLLAMFSTSAQAGAVELVLELDGLGPMKGQHYEGWNIINGEAVTTGRFAFDKNGNIYAVKSTGRKIEKIGHSGRATFDLPKKHTKSSLFVLTIEPNGDADEGPSSVHVIGGGYNSGKANLEISHNSSLGTSFKNAHGKFILAAPTGGKPNQGVWFFNPQNETDSLTLPDLPSGWVYEGWVVNTKNGGKFSTGIFRNTQGADSDGAGLLAGPLKLDFPPVPGQDIVNSKVVLDDGIHAVVVTVEPYPDFDPAPYAIKILKTDLAMGAPGMTPLNLKNIASSAPKGLAHIH